jgi:hypothetical protein
VKPELNFTVGATVLVTCSRPGARDYLAEVMRLTATQVVVSTNRASNGLVESATKYRRDSGRMVGNSWYYSSIRIAENEDIERIAAENIRTKQLIELNSLLQRIHGMDAEQVGELHRILSETGYIKE